MSAGAGAGAGIRVIAFDTFGTVADWHSGVSQTLAELFPDLDGSAVAREWRRRYAPALADVEAGRRPWTLLDDLHRESLVDVLSEHHGVVATAEQLTAAVHSWHILPGWPDSVPGLTRLRTGFTIGALSNGDVALLTEMAAHAGFPWDFVGGADRWRHYKPAAQVYLGVAELTGVRPDEVLMVATHATDLAAARSHGLRTAYVERPREWGPEPKAAERNPLDSFHVRGIDELADLLGC